MITCRTFYGKTKQVAADELKFRPSAYGFITSNDRLLVMELPEIKQWSLPGGGIDIGETSRDAVIRETQEETGLTVAVHDLVAVTEEFFYFDPWDEAWQSVLLFYECPIVGGDVETLTHTDVGEDHEEVPRWVPLDEIDTSLFVPPVQEAYTVWQKRA